MPITSRPVVVPTTPRAASRGAYTFALRRAGLPDFRLDASNGITLLADPGPMGLDDPTLDFVEDTPAGWDGAIVRDIFAEPREVGLPVLLRAADLTGLRALKDRVRAYLNPRLGQVTIRVGVVGGGVRLIDGYYRSGFDTQMGSDAYWTNSQKLAINVRCGRPFWRDETDWRVEWQVPAGRRPLLPILPLAPGSGAVIGGANTITVAGQVETEPVWKVLGPADTVVFLDVGTGRTFTFAPVGGVDSGDEWTIDTRRGRSGVFDPDGVRTRKALNKAADLFPLQPGQSKIQVTATGTTSASKVTGTAPQLYLGA